MQASYDETMKKAYRLQELAKQIGENSAVIPKLEQQMEALAPWKSFDLPLDFKGTKKSVAFIGSIQEEISLEQLREQLEANARSEAMERLLQIQRDQYTMLQSRIIENRRARHDFRQHLRVIQDCANRGDLEDLKSYLANYEKQHPTHSDRVYCNNYALTPFFPSMQIRRKAPESSLTSTFSCPITRSSRRRNCACFSENLLENALDACQTGCSGSENTPPFIRLSRGADGYLHPVHHHGQHQRIQPYLDE